MQGRGMTDGDADGKPAALRLVAPSSSQSREGGRRTARIAGRQAARRCGHAFSFALLSMRGRGMTDGDADGKPAALWCRSERVGGSVAVFSIVARLFMPFARKSARKGIKRKFSSCHV